jgi:phosphatidylinositol-bisphosphatase
MTTEPYKIFCGTWNVNLNAPNTKLDLSKWLLVGSDAPDIYAIGFQEINMSPDTILLSESRPDQPWINKIEEGLAKSSEPYSMLKCVRYVGMMLTIFCKQSIKRNVRLVLEDKVGTGTLNFGNKGAVCASIQLNETYICFVNSHLAAHGELSSF